MITYFDTSALVKKYNLEDHSDKVIEVWNNSETIITSIITFAEIMAVFGRKYQDNALAKNDYNKAVKDIEYDWKALTIVNISNQLLTNIKFKTQEYNLRGFDAIHLCSALYFKDKMELKEVTFACFDKQLNRAAENESFTLINH